MKLGPLTTTVTDIFASGLIESTEADEISKSALALANRLLSLAEAANKRDSAAYLDALHEVTVEFLVLDHVLRSVSERIQLISGPLTEH